MIVAEDVEALLTIGKEHIYVWEAHKNEVHEEEAAVRIAQAVSGANISYEAPQERKSVLNADCKGTVHGEQRTAATDQQNGACDSARAFRIIIGWRKGRNCQAAE